MAHSELPWVVPVNLAQKPVIIRNATLIQTAANKWTPDFLATKLTSKEPYTCYQSDKAKFQ